LTTNFGKYQQKLRTIEQQPPSFLKSCFKQQLKSTQMQIKEIKIKKKVGNVNWLMGTKREN
jgi:hypothetical protein